MEETNYIAVLPLPISKKIGFSVIKQPFDCMQLGIYSSSEILDEAIILSFLTKVKSLIPYIESYHFNVGNSGWPIISDFEGFNTHLLDLSSEYKHISSNYTHYRQRRVKKAYKSGLEIIEHEDHIPLLEMVKEFVVIKNNFNIPEEAFTKMDRLIRILKEKIEIKCLYTQDENSKFHNAALFVKWKNKINYLYSASSEEGRKKNGMSLIIDTIVKQYCNQPIVLDFESPILNSPGIFKFYESFGAKPISIKVWKYDDLPKFVKWLRSQRIKLASKITNRGTDL
ncbi:MAG: hypothetical protein ACXIUD_11725 [Mongoliitalea sp.]